MVRRSRVSVCIGAISISIADLACDLVHGLRQPGPVLHVRVVDDAPLAQRVGLVALRQRARKLRLSAAHRRSASAGSCADCRCARGARCPRRRRARARPGRCRRPPWQASAMALNAGSASATELLMAFSTSAAAVCCGGLARLVAPVLDRSPRPGGRRSLSCQRTDAVQVDAEMAPITYRARWHQRHGEDAVPAGARRLPHLGS